MYKILFIDEEEESIEAFLDYVENTAPSEKIEVVVEYPHESLGDMISAIIEINPDAIITDFMLNDIKEKIKYNVPFNGVDIVEEFTSMREHFPCFVLTSFDDNAMKQSDDVNIVYVKNILHNKQLDENSKATFIERVLFQIKHYKSKLEAAETRLTDLIKLRKKNEATIEQEQEIIDLDHLLENSLNRRSAIPPDYKSLSNASKLEEILGKVDVLLNKIDAKKNE